MTIHLNNNNYQKANYSVTPTSSGVSASGDPSASGVPSGEPQPQAAGKKPASTYEAKAPETPTPTPTTTATNDTIPTKTGELTLTVNPSDPITTGNKPKFLREETKNGIKIRYYSDGSRIETSPDGTVTTYDKNGKVVSKMKNGFPVGNTGNAATSQYVTALVQEDVVKDTQPTDSVSNSGTPSPSADGVPETQVEPNPSVQADNMIPEKTGDLVQDCINYYIADRKIGSAIMDCRAHIAGARKMKEEAERQLSHYDENNPVSQDTIKRLKSIITKAETYMQQQENRKSNLESQRTTVKSELASMESKLTPHQKMDYIRGRMSQLMS